jgi:hypothetical protein
MTAVLVFSTLKNIQKGDTKNGNVSQNYSIKSSILQRVMVDDHGRVFRMMTIPPSKLILLPCATPKYQVGSEKEMSPQIVAIPSIVVKKRPQSMSDGILRLR